MFIVVPRDGTDFTRPRFKISNLKKMSITKVLSFHPAIRDFYKIITTINRASWEAFCDFLKISICSFSRDEQLYSEYVRAYTGDDLEKFAKMLGCVMSYMADTDRECLSELWEAIAKNSATGQFFTPWSLCDAMGELSEIKWYRYSTINRLIVFDPACGGGRTLLGALKQLPSNKINKVQFVGVDIDLNVCNVATLNMLFFNANSIIINGDVTTGEIWRVLKTSHGTLGGEVSVESDPIQFDKYRSMFQQSINDNNQQLRLFDE